MDRILAIRQICKSRTACHGILKQRLHTSIRLLSDKNDSSDSSDSDTEKKPKKNTKKVFVQPERTDDAKKQTADLLNSLLLKMSEKPQVTKTIDLSVPKKKPYPKPPKLPTLEEKIVVAAKDVAASLGGDVEKKESDLLKKVFSAGTPEPPAAVKKVSPKDGKSSTSMSDLLADMKIDRTRKPVAAPELNQFSRSSRVRDSAGKFKFNQPLENMEQLKRRPNRDQEELGKLYEGRSLNIFDPKMEKKEDSIVLSTWEALYQKELKLLVDQPPDNIFQELIQWTNRGMLWKFPIDNEQGMESENDVHFSEHVFLEPHLEEWCPKKGPIRHFMELVCVGLSKNPYMTVEEKIEHIFWFKDYFGQHQELLKELNAIQADILPEKSDKNLFAIKSS